MSPVYSFIPATIGHAAILADKLRPADVAEVRAASGADPLVALINGVQNSDEPFTVFANDEILCMYGMAVNTSTPHWPTVAAPWLLASEEFENHRKLILGSMFKSYVDVMAGRYDLLINMVHADHHKSISWLKWLGFSIDEAQPLGQNGELFHVFHMRGSNVRTHYHSR